MRVLALTRYSRTGASSRVRTYQYTEPLARLGIDLQIAPLFSDAYVAALYARSGRVGAVLAAFAGRLRQLLPKGFDALWVEKEMLPWIPALVELSLLPRGVPLVLDYDDAVFHRYDLHRRPLVRAVLGRKLDRLMARSVLVMAGNEYLAERARQAGAPRVAIVPTVVDLERYPLRAPQMAAGMPTIGWIGSPTTAPYLDSVKSVLREMADERLADAIAIGVRPDQVAGSAFKAVAWSEESEVDSLSRLDIGIMPLVDTPWERGKCGYKLIQYMALGLPVVASPVGVNTEIVKVDNGVLAATPQEWRDGLRALAADHGLRARLGAAGRLSVESGYSLQVWAPRVAELLRQVA